jgi:hypothetical protein
MTSYNTKVDQPTRPRNHPGRYRVHGTYLWLANGGSLRRRVTPRLPQRGGVGSVASRVYGLYFKLGIHSGRRTA